MNYKAGIGFVPQEDIRNIRKKVLLFKFWHQAMQC